ncbi:MAG: ribonuclease P protein component [Gammaproteobacteria bacterium]|nr:MAG: ribonuclease P protein component [Gammaproteobacteria bacterium]
MSQSFPPHLRLNQAADFERVFQGTCKVEDEALLLLASPNGLDHPRLGLAISKRRLPRAVARNRLKRVIRESFRKHQSLLKGLDIVAVARKGIRTKNRAQIFEALERHWLTLSKTCKPSS